MSHYSGRPGVLTIAMESCIRWSGEEWEDTFHTSSVVSYTIEEGKLNVQTLNSIYIFEILEEGLDLSKLEPTPQWMIDRFRENNAAKYLTYWCQIFGNAFIDNAISVVVLPYPMNLQEARDYAAINTLTDVSGAMVYNIMAGKDLP